MVGKMKIQKELGLHMNMNKQAGKIQTLNQEKSDLIVKNPMIPSGAYGSLTSMGNIVPYTNDSVELSENHTYTNSNIFIDDQ